MKKPVVENFVALSLSKGHLLILFYPDGDDNQSRAGLQGFG
jgi:hypothetical protein